VFLKRVYFLKRKTNKHQLVLNIFKKKQPLARRNLKVFNLNFKEKKTNIFSMQVFFLINLSFKVNLNVAKEK